MNNILNIEFFFQKWQIIDIPSPRNADASKDNNDTHLKEYVLKMISTLNDKYLRM